MTQLCRRPSPSSSPRLSTAHDILMRAIESAESLFHAFGELRKDKKGAPTDHHQDILRSALVFAAAGLDAVVKQLVKDALSAVVDLDPGAHDQFVNYLHSRLSRQPLDTKWLARALANAQPREYARDDYINELTSHSLQSKDQLLRVAAAFAIPANEVAADVKQIQEVFIARNQIIHEMDILFGPNRSRRSRKQATIRAHTTTLLEVATRFYEAVAKRLGPHSDEGK